MPKVSADGLASNNPVGVTQEAVMEPAGDGGFTGDGTPDHNPAGDTLEPDSDADLEVEPAGVPETVIT